MSIILIQIGEMSPDEYKHFPLGLQHLIKISAPIRWQAGSHCAATRNSRFWKKVRYLMPAVPATKSNQCSICWHPASQWFVRVLDNLEHPCANTVLSDVAKCTCVSFLILFFNTLFIFFNTCWLVIIVCCFCSIISIYLYTIQSHHWQKCAYCCHHVFQLYSRKYW